MPAPLDLDAVQAFVYIAELESFTRAADAMGMTQAAVSMKLKRLEERLGVRLVERSPRYVQISRQGAIFLDHARELLSAHARALAMRDGGRQRVVVGIGDHVAGPDLPALIAQLNAKNTRHLMEVRIGTSTELLQSFDRREFDAVISRIHVGRDDGELLAEEKFSWFAGPSWEHREAEPLPLVTMAEPCGVRALAAHVLDSVGMAWTEIFIGGGVATVAAAVVAGVGVAALAPRMIQGDAIDVGKKLGLPDLPRMPILLHSRARTRVEKEMLEELVVGFRHLSQG